MKLLSREEVKKIDQQVVHSGQPQAALIETVGAKLSQWLHPKIASENKVLVLMGPGHNGDDAAVVHRRLRHHVQQLVGLRIGDSNSSFLHSEEQLYDLDNYSSLNFDDFDWIIDGLFGTGLTRELSPEIQDLIDDINMSSATKVAIDIPTGLDCNTGEIHGIALQADHTLTIAAPKRGLYLLPGRDFCGEIHCLEVNALNQVVNLKEIATHSLPRFDYIGLRPLRRHHKYNRGQVSVTMSEDFPGASLMVAYSAQHAGAGYVQVYAPAHLLNQLQIQHPTLVFIAYKSQSDLGHSIQHDKSQSVVLGSGWKQFPEDFKWSYLEEKTIVLDGGSLSPQIFQATQKFAHRCVMTPHSGELRRIMGDAPDCKWDLVQALLKKWEGVVVAKGHDTIIGQGANRRWITTWNSSSLATAGSGDILAGIVAAFLAQGFPPQQAACLAVDAHRRLASHHPVCISPSTLLARIEDVLNLPEQSNEEEST